MDERELRYHLQDIVRRLEVLETGYKPDAAQFVDVRGRVSALEKAQHALGLELSILSSRIDALHGVCQGDDNSDGLDDSMVALKEADALWAEWSVKFCRVATKMSELKALIEQSKI